MNSPLFEKLLGRLTVPAVDHERFKGSPLDIEGLTPRELGLLWPLLQRLRDRTDNSAAAEAARSILQQARERQCVPLLDESLVLECFRDLEVGALAQAIDLVALLGFRPTPALATEARRLLADRAACIAQRMHAAVLARVGGGALLRELEDTVAHAFAGSPFVVDEFRALREVSEAAMLAFASSPFVTYFGPHFHPDAADPAGALAEEPAYVEFAEQALRRAAQRLQEVHSGAVPYVADAVFTVDDAAVIARAARVALLRDETWLGDIMASLLPQACVAPTAAKTAPSQSLAISLGHAIQSSPTPESVLALREALKVVRHAGLGKKLARNLKPAERALVQRPAVALRLAGDVKTDKRLATMLATCLEAGLWRELQMTWREWNERLLQTAAGESFGTRLIWQVQSPAGHASFMLDRAANGMRPVRFDEREVQLSDTSRVGLWHPANAGATEREGWQAWIGSRQIRQPIRQAFREHYFAAHEEAERHCTEMFAGHVLAVRPMIGLANREGWTVDKWEGVRRVFGDLRITLQVDPGVYPGADGDCTTQHLHFETRQSGKWTPAKIGALPPALFSEACRAVDLLVSVAAFAIDDASLPPTRPGLSTRHPPAAPMTLTEIARMRHAVLRQVLARQLADGRANLEERHLLIGDCAIHLSTARVTRAGAPVELELPSGPQLHAVPWLPYDEKLLQRIVDTAGVLLSR